MGELSMYGGGGGVPAKKSVKKAVKKAAKKAPAKKAVKKAAAKKAAKKAPGKKAPPKKAARSATMTAPGRANASKVRELPAPPTDPLVVLGLDTSFTRNDLRRAWREYAARHHPDQGGDGSTFARGRAAYEVLRTLLAERG